MIHNCNNITTNHIDIINDNTINQWKYINQGKISVTYKYVVNNVNNDNKHDDLYINYVLKINKNIVHNLLNNNITYNNALQYIQYDILYYNQLNKVICGNINNDNNDNKQNILCYIASNKLITTLLTQANIYINIQHIQYIPIILMYDATLLYNNNNSNILQPNIVIEIKPKWAILPHNNDLQHHTNLQHNNNVICRYCIQQYSKKYKHNIINSISNYCSIDLYSFGEQRVSNAVNALLHNTQNNITLFKNNNNNINLININNYDDTTLLQYILTTLICNKSSKLYKIMKRVKQLQSICLYSIHDIYNIYNRYITLYSSDDLNELQNNIIQYSLLNALTIFDDSVQQDIDNVQYCNRHKWKVVHNNNQLTVNNDSNNITTTIDIYSLTKQQCETILSRFLVCTTLRDMSYMIPLHISTDKLDSSIEYIAVTYNNALYHVYYNVYCIDLDRKLLSKIPYYYQQNIDLVTEFVNNHTLVD